MKDLLKCNLIGLLSIWTPTCLVSTTFIPFSSYEIMINLLVEKESYCMFTHFRTLKFEFERCIECKVPRILQIPYYQYQKTYTWRKKINGNDTFNKSSRLTRKINFLIFELFNPSYIYIIKSYKKITNINKKPWPVEICFPRIGSLVS